MGTRQDEGLFQTFAVGQRLCRSSVIFHWVNGFRGKTLNVANQDRRPVTHTR